MIKQQAQPQQVPPHSAGSNGSVKTRKRSSSRTKSNYNPTSSHEQQQASLRTTALTSFQQQMPPLNQLVWVLKLKSLNGTFDFKTLVVPEAPDTLKFGRPGGSKIQSKPTNGFFDSRVLSRNHAELFIGESSGSLFIRDLKSSNGTYINGKQIEPFVEYQLNIGDKFDLGSNLENQTAHKKISCEVSDLLLMDFKEFTEVAYSAEKKTQPNDKEYFNNVMGALIYGDVVNDMYEENLLNMLASDEPASKSFKADSSFSISGLFPSSNIKNSSKLEDTIAQLLVLINKETLQNEKLNKVHRFLNQYNENIQKVTEALQESDRIDSEASQKEITRYKEQLAASEDKMKDLQAKIDSLSEQQIAKDQQQQEWEKSNESLRVEISEKDNELTELRKRIEEITGDYNDLAKEKEIIINFKNGESNKESSNGEARKNGSVGAASGKSVEEAVEIRDDDRDEPDADVATGNIETADDVDVETKEKDVAVVPVNEENTTEKDEDSTVPIDESDPDSSSNSDDPGDSAGSDGSESTVDQTTVPCAQELLAVEKKQAPFKVSHILHATLVLAVSIFVGGAVYHNK